MPNASGGLRHSHYGPGCAVVTVPFWSMSNTKPDATGSVIDDQTNSRYLKTSTTLNISDLLVPTTHLAKLLL